ncbi:MAG: Rrf2 family transcriptional regulator [Candidatus Krumholzibacteria bacterium]|nr:Rrf2 family transcriptional regulator [Candidatus Krumholzibacteria bacterium]
MDVIRRNTDYAIRAMILVGQADEGVPVSTRKISDKADIPYQLACKVMQRLHGAGLVKSKMGPTGGFMLKKDLTSINLHDIVEAVQGAVSMNKCIGEVHFCRHRPHCSVAGRMEELQLHIKEFLEDVSLEDLVRDCSFRDNCC